MDISTLINNVIGREGGYSNHPADKGGPTRWGVTEAVARAHGFYGDMRTFPREQAIQIYHKLYWQKPGFDRLALLAPRIAAEMFDTGVNMGPATAIGFLVRALNALNRGGKDFADLGAQGRIDDAILAAVKAFHATRGAAGELVLLRAIDALQAERYVSLAERRPANEAFLYGWLANRIGVGDEA
jgi:lysozyme family protein